MLGHALRVLRTRQKLTQQQAADAMGVTRGAWQNYETGRAIILRTDIQTRLARALGTDRQELLLQLAAQTPSGQRPQVSGLSDRDSPFEGPDRQKAVFPLPEGEIVLSFPTNLSPESFGEFSEFLALFLKSRRPRDS